MRGCLHVHGTTCIHCTERKLHWNASLCLTWDLLTFYKLVWHQCTSVCICLSVLRYVHKREMIAGGGIICFNQNNLENTNSCPADWRVRLVTFKIHFIKACCHCCCGFLQCRLYFSYRHSISPFQPCLPKTYSPIQLDGITKREMHLLLIYSHSLTVLNIVS